MKELAKAYILPFMAAAFLAFAIPHAAAGQAVERVRLGVLGVAADAGFYVAADQGYFAAQGLDIELIPFDSAARMVPALATGQLDVGSGSHSAGLLNAAARGIESRIVADRGSSLPGQGFQALLFRRALVESGGLRSPADLRGRRVAILGQGLITEVVLAQWLRAHGLTLDDVTVEELPFPDHVGALANGAIDASITIEPFATLSVERGLATLWQRSDELQPGQQAAAVFYSGEFARARPAVGRRFMAAYLQAVRLYNDAFVRGDCDAREQVIDSLVRHTPVRDRALYERMVLPGLHPDGRLNLASMAEDQEFWLARGHQQERIDLTTLIDYQFVDVALQALGPHE